MNSRREQGTTGLNIQLDRFQGPFELLFHLITENEIDIFDIPIARITDQYLAHLNSMRELNLDIAGEFIVMAATLLQIKARMLLPSPKSTEEEEEDPREKLVQQLIAYRQFKEVAQVLGEREETWSKMFFARVHSEFPVKYDRPVGDAQVSDLWEALQRVLLARREATPREHTLKRHLELNERIVWLGERIVAAGSLSFSELFDETTTVEEVVVTFLALLELARRKVVTTKQESTFGDILIEIQVGNELKATGGVSS